MVESRAVWCVRQRGRVRMVSAFIRSHNVLSTSRPPASRTSSQADTKGKEGSGGGGEWWMTGSGVHQADDGGKGELRWRRHRLLSVLRRSTGAIRGGAASDIAPAAAAAAMRAKEAMAS